MKKIYKNQKLLFGSMLCASFILLPALSHSQTEDENISLIQNKIKEYDSLIAKEVENNSIDEKMEVEKLVKEEAEKKSEINKITTSNENLSRQIEEKITQSQQLEKTIAELVEKNEIETKATREKEMRSKMLHESQRIITNSWLENSHDVENLLAQIDPAISSKIKCIVEARVDHDGRIFDATVVKPSLFGLFDSMAQHAVMDAGYIRLPANMTTSKIVFTRNNATMMLEDEFAKR
jgi:hypothetical protein